MLNITIDGRALEAREGQTVLEAAREAGIHIPTLCYLAERSAIGSCRVCVVDVEGQDAPVPACTTRVVDGMQVQTATERVLKYRRMAVDLLISNHGLDSTDYCFSCVKNGACELQAVAREVGVSHPTFPVAQTRKPVLDSNPFLRFDPNLCIACQRCVGACNNAAGNHVLQTGKRGVRTTCPHCGVGCQLDLVVKGDQIVDVQAADGPSNDGLLCVKGRSGSFDFVNSPDRITTPLVKNPETGEFEPADWDTALDLVARRFAELKEEHGGESIAAFACSRSTNEDIYLFQKMARCAFDSPNVDNCARV